MKNEKLRWIGGLRPSQNHGEGRGTDSVSARVQATARRADIEPAPTVSTRFEAAAGRRSTTILHSYFLIFHSRTAFAPDHFVP